MNTYVQVRLDPMSAVELQSRSDPPMNTCVQGGSPMVELQSRPTRR